jgi:hypothetical protein
MGKTKPIHVTIMFSNFNTKSMYTEDRSHIDDKSKQKEKNETEERKKERGQK